MASCLPQMGSWRGRLVLGASLMVAVNAVLVGLGGEETQEAERRLKELGAELSLPGFEHDPSLLNWAFSNQSELPSPAGSLSKNIKVVSTSPYALQIDDFLSARECAFLRSLGVPRLKPAMVVQSGDNWYDTQTSTRNNEQVWLTQPEEREIPVLTHIMKRIHRTTRVPDEYAEALQIGRYQVAQKYEGHVDSDPGNKVGRPTTVLLYLSDVEEGGETVFPNGRTDCGTAWRTHPKTGEKVYGAKVCCETPEDDTPTTVRVSPKMGRAVVFFSHKPDGVVDRTSNHIACPIIKGEKWIAQRWLRFEPYNRVRYDTTGFDARYDGLPTDQTRTLSRDEVHTRVVSQISPKLFMQEHFLDAAEIAHLKGLLGNDQKDLLLSSMAIEEDEALTAMTGRAYLFALLPSTTPAELRLRRFKEGESDPVHMNIEKQSPDHPIAVTVSVYLETVEDGGELFFPEVPSNRCNEDMVACCEATELKWRPHRGDAALLYSYNQKGVLDPSTKHGHCPLKKGESWVAQWRFLFEPLIQGQPASEPEKTKPKVLFENQGSQTFNIFWQAPHGGGETSMGHVDAGGTTSLNSFANHIFTVRDEAGKLVDRFTVGTTGHQRFIITDKAEL